MTAMLLQALNRADGQQVGHRENGIEIDPAFQQPVDRRRTLLARDKAIDGQVRVRRHPGLDVGAQIALVALEEFRVALRRLAQENDAPPALGQQVRNRRMGAAGIVGADEQVGIVLHLRTEDHPGLADPAQVLDLLCIGFEIAITQEDDAVGAAGEPVILAPVAALVLQRHQHVDALFIGIGQDRADQRQEERIDAVVGLVEVLRHQDGNGVDLLGTQLARIDVDDVVEPGRRLEDTAAHLFADRRRGAERARHGRLGHPGQGGDVEGGGTFHVTLFMVLVAAIMTPGTAFDKKR